MTGYNATVFVLSLILNLLIIKSADKYGLFLDPVNGAKLQSFHKNKTPRAGGLSIYIVSLLFTYFVSPTMFYVILGFLPAFAYGLYEDMKGDTPQKFRLIIMALSTLLACLISGVKVESIGFINIPEIAQIPFTVFGVIGLASAINFIDGLNGLASGVTMVTFLAMGIAADATGNHELALSMYLISSSMLGFFILNFPKGKIFLGDAGAYFLGYMLAMSSGALVLNNSDISPWYPVALLGYPIIETFITMARRYRRLKRKGVKFFTAEKVHLHSLLYLRVFRNNALSSSSIVILFIINALIAYQLKESHIQCALLFLLEGLTYIFFYKNILNFKLGKLAILSFKLIDTKTIQNPVFNTNLESTSNIINHNQLSYNEDNLIMSSLEKREHVKTVK